MQHWRWWLAATAVLTFILVYGLWQDADAQRPSSAFHGAAAQIIPVLVVAIVLEQSHHSQNLRSPGLPLVIFALLVGEIAAMCAVAFGEQKSKNAPYIVGSLPLTDVLSLLSALALVIGFIGVLGVAVRTVLDEDK